MTAQQQSASAERPSAERPGAWRDSAQRPSPEMVSRRAVAAALQARPARRANRGGRTAAPASAGLALSAVGLICLLAVRDHAGPLNVRTAGVILIAVGLVWLWLPVRDKRARLRAQFERAMAYLEWDPGEAGAARCSLTDLLDRPAGAGAAEPGGTAAVAGSDSGGDARD